MNADGVSGVHVELPIGDSEAEASGPVLMSVDEHIVSVSSALRPTPTISVAEAALRRGLVRRQFKWKTSSERACYQ
jgi:hypothetical protein